MSDVTETPVPVFASIVTVPPGHARLNITMNRQNGDLAQSVPYALPHDEVVRIAIEAVRSGSVPGIHPDAADAHARADFVVDTYEAMPDRGMPYPRLVLRIKTAFGAAFHDERDSLQQLVRDVRDSENPQHGTPESVQRSAIQELRARGYTEREIAVWRLDEE